MRVTSLQRGELALEYSVSSHTDIQRFNKSVPRYCFDFLQDESFVEISQPSMCSMCEQDESLLKTKVQGFLTNSF